MSAIGFFLFYGRWIPWTEVKLSPLSELSRSFELDHKFSAKEFTAVHVAAYEDIKAHIISKPILQRANPRKQFYLKTDFSSNGLGFGLCQPSDDNISIDAMKQEEEGGE
eukprot:10193058-Ditylum_brightwellii.AAC.1